MIVEKIFVLGAIPIPIQSIKIIKLMKEIES